eukprot:1656012-Prymnesium_polylepis.1
MCIRDRVAPEGDDEDTAASGLKWNKAGTKLPQHGIELRNEELSSALESKAEFTEHEWRQFGINELTTTHFIRSRGRYFRPAAAVQDQKLDQKECQGRTTCRGRSVCHGQGGRQSPPLQAQRLPPGAMMTYERPADYMYITYDVTNERKGPLRNGLSAGEVVQAQRLRGGAMVSYERSNTYMCNLEANGQTPPSGKPLTGTSLAAYREPARES